jgi:hypothetical protein
MWRPSPIASNSSPMTVRGVAEVTRSRMDAHLQVSRVEEWWKGYGPPLVYGAHCTSRGAGSIPARFSQSPSSNAPTVFTCSCQRGQGTMLPERWLNQTSNSLSHGQWK